jgi:hypothetical protein
MKTTNPIQTLTGFLGRDVETALTTQREYSRVEWDPVTDGEVEIHGTTALREYAKLSLAVHQGSGRSRGTRWVQLRAFDLDHHPDEARIRTARRGQRVEVQGYLEVHRYTDRANGEEREFEYFLVTGFRPRPGRRLRAGERSSQAA